MTTFDWRAYRAGITESVPHEPTRDRLVTLARDAADTGSPVAVLALVEESLICGVLPPMFVRQAFSHGVTAYFRDKQAERSLEWHLGLVRPGRGSPHRALMRHGGERKFFRKVYRLWTETGLAGAEAVALVYQRDITRSPQFDKEPSVEAMTKLWKWWRGYFDDERDDDGREPDRAELEELLAFLVSFEAAAKHEKPSTERRLADGVALVERRLGRLADSRNPPGDRGMTAS